MDGVRILGKTGRFKTGSTLGSAVGADEEDKSKEQQTTTGEAAFGGGSSTVKPVTQQAAPQTKGSGFTNVQKILKASGTDTGPSRLAQTAAGGVRQAASGAQQALTGAIEKFGKETGESTKAIPTSGTVSNIISGALGGTLSDADLSTYQKATSGTYAGPTSLQMTPEQQREAAKSSALSRLAGDVSGRSALLQKYVGSPQYGQSKQTLDTLLLGRGGSAALRGALRQGARTEQDIKRQEIVAQEQAKQAQERARGIAEEAKSGLEQAKTGLMAQLEAKKQQDAEYMSGAMERVKNFLIGSSDPNSRGTRQVSRADLRILGLTEEQLAGIATGAGRVGIDPTFNPALTKESLKYTLMGLGLGQYAGPTQQAQLLALGRLAGQENLGLSDLGQASQYSEAGAFDLDAYRSSMDTAIDKYIKESPSYVKQKTESKNQLQDLRYIDFPSSSSAKEAVASGGTEGRAKGKISWGELNNLLTVPEDTLNSEINKIFNNIGYDVNDWEDKNILYNGNWYQLHQIKEKILNQVKKARTAEANAQSIYDTSKATFYRPITFTD